MSLGQAAGPGCSSSYRYRHAARHGPRRGTDRDRVAGTASGKTNPPYRLSVWSGAADQYLPEGGVERAEDRIGPDLSLEISRHGCVGSRSTGKSRALVSLATSSFISPRLNSV